MIQPVGSAARRVAWNSTPRRARGTSSGWSCRYGLRTRDPAADAGLSSTVEAFDGRTERFPPARVQGDEFVGGIVARLSGAPGDVAVRSHQNGSLLAHLVEV